MAVVDMFQNRTSVGTVRQVVERFEARKSFMVDTTENQIETPEESFITADGTYPGPGTPTPTSSRSRQTSRTYESPATTPPPLPSHERIGKRNSDDSLTGPLDDLPLSDPRRFTPTLHASLVSEILSLRRDAETKSQDIERLEQSLHDAQIQNQTLSDNVFAAKGETRQVRRQMQLLEGGTLSAINDLAKERDEALKEASELKNRVDQAQGRSKSLEDEVHHLQEQGVKDREAYNAEKRNLETKMHIVEGRLKVVLSEVAKVQQLQGDDVHSPRRSQSRTSMLGSPRKRPDSVAQRRQSINSNTSDQFGGRISAMSFLNGDSTNLADELGLDGIDEDYASQPEEDDRMSPEPTHEHMPRPSSRVSLKARRVLGLPIDLSEFEQIERTHGEQLSSLPEVDSPKSKTQGESFYVDTGIQYSRPSTPVQDIGRRSLETPVPRNRESVDTARASKTLSVVSQADSAQYSVDTSDFNWQENLNNQPIMVSSGCQTTEQLPPPQTSKTEQLLATIDESVETREIAIQTENPVVIHAPKPIAVHRRSDTEQSSGSTELQIPTIAIIPPTSRPVTPDEHAVKLPPRTKSASCQVETHLLVEYNSKGMQTEEIRIDKRNMIPPVPSMPPPPVPANLPPPSSFNKSKTQPFTRRNATNTANSSMRRSTPTQGMGPYNDDGPLSELTQDLGRPVRRSSMFAGFDEADDMNDFEEDVFHDDDFFNKPTTKLVLSRGKILAATKDLEDIEESEAAVAAGKRFALEQIRRSQEDERDFEIEGDSIKPYLRNLTKQVKRIPSARTSSIRRTALISSGNAAHAHQTRSSLSSLGSGDSARPPMPIPVRYSSARVGKSISDGGRSSRGSSNPSPTRHGRRIHKTSLRKTRSGPALSPAAQAARRARSRSPPLENRVSIVPDMPNFRMPAESRAPSVVSGRFATTFGASAPVPSIAQGPPRSSTANLKDNADNLASSQQTSVVDAIAQTMVGEWMYKYVRRRKSFGKPDKDWDFGKSVEEMSNTSSGVRHKRWVWLAPYERSVMWSSKQPTDGTSLLGKSGRKLTIKSVLDVKDDNPMPKGSIAGLHFNRSILILTPQRALKFTATTQERHYIWLTALSFLSHSPISMHDLAPLPPMPPEAPEDNSPAATLGGSLRRRPIRDSIRIAKGSSARPQFRSFTTDGIPTMSEYERPPAQDQYDPINDAALPPVIRRYHNRNRSNTAPKPTASAFRALLSRDSAPSAAPSTAVTSEKTFPSRGPETPSLGVPSLPGSRRGSEASALGRPPLGTPIQNIDMPNRFFDTSSNSSHAASMTMHKVDAFMAQQHNAMVARGNFGRGPTGPMRRLARPSMRNLKDPSTSSWAAQQSSFRDSMSPVETLASPTDMEKQFRFSESTTRGSSEAAGYMRGY